MTYYPSGKEEERFYAATKAFLAHITPLTEAMNDREVAFFTKWIVQYLREIRTDDEEE